MEDGAQHELFGRATEAAILQKCFSDILLTSTSTSRSHLVLLEGPHGVGKRTLGRTLQPRVEEVGGLFLSGRSRPSVLHNNVNDNTLHTTTNTTPTVTDPFAVFRDAFKGISDSMDEPAKCLLRETLASQCTNPYDEDALIELLGPVTSRIYLPESLSASSASRRPSPLPQRLKSIGTSSKLCEVLVRFLETITVRQPLVLLLESIDCTDKTNLDILQALLETKNDGHGLLLIATTFQNGSSSSEAMQQLTQRLANTLSSEHRNIFADDETTQSSTIEAIGSSRVTFLPLPLLSREDVFNWTFEHAANLNCAKEKILHVAHVIYEKSEGNPRLVRYLLRYLSLEHADKPITDQTLDNVRATNSTGTANDLFALLIQKQNSNVRELVKSVAALAECSEQDIDSAILDMVLQRPSMVELQTALKSDILTVVHGAVQFPCPVLQKVAYSMIPECDRALFHLKIGRDLWEHSAVFTENENMDDPFAILRFISQNLQLGFGLVTEAGELDIIATINLRVGKIAMQSSQFSGASMYFDRAISALGARQWSAALYDISLELYNCSSEAYYCANNFDRMDLTLEVIYSKATSFEDKLQAYATEVFANGARNRLQQALSKAVYVLKELGVILPENPGKLTLIRQYQKTQRILSRKSNRTLLSLPTATGTRKIAAMQMLSFAMVFSYFINPEMGAVVVFRLIQLILEYGMTASAAPAFGAYGYLLSMHLGNRKDAVRFGQVSLELLRQLDEDVAKAWLPRTYFMVHVSLNHWALPVQGSLEPLMLAHRSALKTGDMEFAMRTAHKYLEYSFYSGKQLDTLANEARSMICLADSLGQTVGLVDMLPVWDMLTGVMSDVDLPLNLTSHISNSEAALQYASEAGNAISLWIWYLHRATYFCFNGDYQGCMDMTKKVKEANASSYIWCTFYEGLSHLAIARASGCSTRWSNFRLGRQAAKLIKRWARLCPSNCFNKQLLLEAEIAAFLGRTKRALSLFHQSIQTAKEEGFLGEVGLAYERLALYCRQARNKDDAVVYFGEARDVYNQWGARTLSKRINDHVANL